MESVNVLVGKKWNPSEILKKLASSIRSIFAFIGNLKLDSGMH